MEMPTRQGRRWLHDVAWTHRSSRQRLRRRIRCGFAYQPVSDYASRIGMNLLLRLRSVARKRRWGRELTLPRPWVAHFLQPEAPADANQSPRARPKQVCVWPSLAPDAGSSQIACRLCRREVVSHVFDLEMDAAAARRPAGSVSVVASSRLRPTLYLATDWLKLQGSLDDGTIAQGGFSLS